MCLLPPGPLRCVSAPSSSGSPEPSRTATQDLYVWRMPEHNAALQLNFALSRQEVMRRNSNITTGYFSKWNTPCWHLKKDKHKLFCWSLGWELCSRKYGDAYIELGFTMNPVGNRERPVCVLCKKLWQQTAWNHFDNQVIVCRMLPPTQWFIQINKEILSGS